MSATFLYNICLNHSTFSEVLSEMATDFHVKYPIFLLDFNQS